MSTPQTTGEARPAVHWAVRMNHRNRTVFFALLFLLLSAHVAGDSAFGALGWALLALNFLVHPHAAWLAARGARLPFEAERINMRFDALCFGAWIGALHFPLWIGFTLFTGAAQNMVLFLGVRGFVEAVALTIAGALAAGLATGWAFAPQTSPTVTAFSMLLVSAYLAVSGFESYRRSMGLHKTRQELARNQQALHEELARTESLQAQLREKVRRDPLTGLYNRHDLQDVLSRELARSARTRRPFAVLMVDIDHFKRVNDGHGHLAGDAVIRSTAALLSARSRTSDMAFRFGGEEFLLLLPETDEAPATKVAEALRAAHQLEPTLHEGVSIATTLSIGVAVHRAEHPEDAVALVRAADEALYRAKQSGRNRVELAARGH